MSLVLLVGAGLVLLAEFPGTILTAVTLLLGLLSLESGGYSTLELFLSFPDRESFLRSED